MAASVDALILRIIIKNIYAVPHKKTLNVCGAALL